jgi:hypothetical protein
MSETRKTLTAAARARSNTRKTVRWLLGCCSFAAPALVSTLAFAQIAMPPSPLYPVDPAKPLYYKDGNGPGTAYLQRWLPSDNYGTSGCVAPQANDLIGRFTDPLKCVAIGGDGHSYIVFNGTERLRYENFQYGSLGTKSRSNAAGMPIATAGQGIGASTQREGYLTHTALGADLHLTDYFRAYGQLDNATYSGSKLVRPGPSASGRDDLSVVALFAEGKTKVGHDAAYPLFRDTILGLRAGRENLGFGSDDFWFAPNGGTNLAGTSFDGFHAYADQGATRLDLFAAHIVNEVNFDPNNGNTVLQDRDNARQVMWGGHLSHDLSPFSAWGIDGRTGIDAFYYGYSNSAAQYTNSAFLTAPTSLAITSAASFITAHDYRHSIGLRYYGRFNDFTFDYSGVLQRGSFGAYNVSAWAFHTVTGYNFPALPWQPWAGVQIDGASGGVSQASKGGSNTIMTFQPMRVDALAVSTISVDQALSNVIALSPRFDLHPKFSVGGFDIENLIISVRNNFYLRQQENDAVYAGSYFGNQTASGSNPYQLTAITHGQFIGYQPNLRVSWGFMPHLTYGLDLAYQMEGAALKAIGAKDTLYIRNQLVFNF